MTIEETWGSPANAVTAAEAEALLAGAWKAIRAARRRNLAFVAWTGFALSVTTGGVTYLWMTRPAGLSGQWALHLLLAGQWAVLALAVRHLLAARAGRPRPVGPVRAMLEALRQEALRDRRLKLAVLALLAGAAPASLSSITHLQHAGKMARHEAASATVLLATILVVMATLVLARLTLAVGPRLARLERLLDQYRDPI